MPEYITVCWNAVSLKGQSSEYTEDKCCFQSERSTRSVKFQYQRYHINGSNNQRSKYSQIENKNMQRYQHQITEKSVSGRYRKGAIMQNSSEETKKKLLQEKHRMGSRTSQRPQKGTQCQNTPVDTGRSRTGKDCTGSQRHDNR